MFLLRSQRYAAWLACLLGVAVVLRLLLVDQLAPAVAAPVLGAALLLAISIGARSSLRGKARNLLIPIAMGALALAAVVSLILAQVASAGLVPKACLSLLMFVASGFALYQSQQASRTSRRSLRNYYD
jgi:hypothetical protein